VTRGRSPGLSSNPARPAAPLSAPDRQRCGLSMLSSWR
jgi:hypothetical protein